MHHYLHALLAALVLLVSHAACASGSDRVHISNARVVEAPPVMGMNAGYLEIDNGTPSPVTLTHVSSVDFARIEIHRSVIEDGIARMTPVGPVSIAAQSRFIFEPGAYHLMLFQAAQSLHAGDSVKLMFHFADGAAIEVKAKIVKMNNEVTKGSDLEI
jgi:copper(I)-binding protein